MKKALIVSRKFNYGHYYLLVGWKRMLELADYEPLFFFDEKYLAIVDSNGMTKYGDLKKLNEVELVVIINISTEDRKVLSCLSTQNRYKTILLYHEPWRGLKEELKRYRGQTVGFIKQLGRNYFVHSILKSIDLVMCPSSYCKIVFEQNEARYNKNYCEFPLICTDEVNKVFVEEKRFFSFISTATIEKGIEEFFYFVKFASSIDNEICFQIVTKTDITKYIDDEIEQLLIKKRLHLQHKKVLTEEEINNAYNRSLCTWLAYRSSTQSGVIVKAFMCGSPVIATPIGEFGKQVNGRNGVLVKSCKDYKEIYDAYLRIKKEKESYIECAKQSFIDFFSPEKNVVKLKKILIEFLDD